MIAKLIWKLDDPHEREGFENSLNGSKYKAQIDALYGEVFRPYIKHGLSFIGVKDDCELPFVFVTEDEYGVKRELTVNGLIAQEMEQAVVEAIWEKCHKHFNGEE